MTSPQPAEAVPGAAGGQDCQAAHCPPSMHTDCEWPRCAETPQPRCGQCGRTGDASRDVTGISTLYSWPYEGAERYVCRGPCRNTDDDELAIVKRTLAAAYRQAAGWLSNDGDSCAMLAVANDVEAFRPDDPCCPCCEEVTCDAGCPLEPVRQP